MTGISANKRIARNSLLLSIRLVIVLLISLYTTRIVLSVLGVEDYGIFNVVCGFVSLLSFLTTSMSNGIQRFFNYEFGKNGVEGANRVYCHALIIQIILAIIIIVLAESIGLWYLFNKMVIPVDRFIAAQCIYHSAVISLVFVILQVPYNAAIMAHERMDYFAFLSVLDAVLRLGIVLLLPYLYGDKLIIYGLLILAIGILNFFLSYIYCKRRFKEILWRKRFEKQLFLSMVGFSGWNLFGTFSGVMRDQGINIVLNLFGGPVVNAARGIAIQINSALRSFVGNIQIPVRPQIVQSYAQNNIDKSISLMYTVSKLSCCVFLTMAVPLSMEINYVLNLWLGKSIPTFTSIFTIIVVYNTLISILNSSTSMIVHASGIMKNYQLYGSIVQLLSIPISYIALKYGADPEIALILVFLFDALSHIVCLFVVKGIISISIWDYTKKIVFPIAYILFISLPFLFIIRQLLKAGFIRFIISITFGVICVITISYLVALTSNEKAIVKSYIKKMINKVR